MKKRRVMVTLELDTTLSLLVLKSAKWWSKLHGVERCLQAQANVIRERKKARRKA